MLQSRISKPYSFSYILAFLPKRFLLRTGFALALVLSIYSLLHSWLTNPDTWPISSIKITGNYMHVDREALQKEILPFTEKGFLALDIQALKEQLEHLPWVAQVQVSRTWPDQLQIDIHEQQPVARWNQSDLLNSQGDLFQLGKVSLPQGLPELFGSNEQRNLILLNYQQLGKLIQALNMHISILALSPRQAWQIRLNNGIWLLLGREHISERLQRLLKVYANIVGERAADIDYIDLRYSNGMAVHWKTAQSLTG